MQARAPAPAPPPRARAGKSPSRSNEIEWQSLFIAGFGAACAVIIWLIVGALTGLGKSPSLVFPAALVIAVAGALIGLTRAAFLLWLTTAIAIVGFCVIAMTPFVTSLLPTGSLVRRDRLPAAPAQLDAVVVLSAGITPDALLSPEAADRLLTGLALMRDSIAPVLVVTEPHRSKYVTAADDQARLRALVARPFPMLKVDSVRTTHDEAVNAWRLLSPRRATRIAVVTSPLHTRRACSTFEQVGFTVTCVPAVSRVYSVYGADTGPERLILFREWIYERAALIEYRMRGWLKPTATR